MIISRSSKFRIEVDKPGFYSTRGFSLEEFDVFNNAISEWANMGLAKVSECGDMGLAEVFHVSRVIALEVLSACKVEGKIIVLEFSSSLFHNTVEKMICELAKTNYIIQGFHANDVFHKFTGIAEFINFNASNSEKSYTLRLKPAETVESYDTMLVARCSTFRVEADGFGFYSTDGFDLMDAITFDLDILGTCKNEHLVEVVCIKEIIDLENPTGVSVKGFIIYISDSLYEHVGEIRKSIDMFAKDNFVVASRGISKAFDNFTGDVLISYRDPDRPNSQQKIIRFKATDVQKKSSSKESLEDRLKRMSSNE